VDTREDDNVPDRQSASGSRQETQRTSGLHRYAAGRRGESADDAPKDRGELCSRHKERAVKKLRDNDGGTRARVSGNE